MNCIEADNVIYNVTNLNDKEMKMTQQVIDNLNAQLEASKQMYNETVNALYQVRTENVMLKKQFQTFVQNMQTQNAPAVEEPKPAEDIAVGEPHPGDLPIEDNADAVNP
jgi:deoxyribodipyrimidine photolyase